MGIRAVPGGHKSCTTSAATLPLSRACAWFSLCSTFALTLQARVAGMQPKAYLAQQVKRAASLWDAQTIRDTEEGEEEGEEQEEEEGAAAALPLDAGVAPPPPPGQPPWQQQLQGGAS